MKLKSAPIEMPFPMVARDAVPLMHAPFLLHAGTHIIIIAISMYICSGLLTSVPTYCALLTGPKSEVSLLLHQLSVVICRKPDVEILLVSPICITVDC